MGTLLGGLGVLLLGVAVLWLVGAVVRRGEQLPDAPGQRSVAVLRFAHAPTPEPLLFLTTLARALAVDGLTVDEASPGEHGVAVLLSASKPRYHAYVEIVTLTEPHIEETSWRLTVVDAGTGGPPNADALARVDAALRRSEMGVVVRWYRREHYIQGDETDGADKPIDDG